MAVEEFAPKGEIKKLVDNQSVPAGGSFDSAAVNSLGVRKARAWYKTKGANSTAKLQGSFDNTAWYDLQTLSAGVNQIVDVAEPYVRVTVSNAGASPETNDVWVYFQT